MSRRSESNSAGVWLRVGDENHLAGVSAGFEHFMGTGGLGQRNPFSHNRSDLAGLKQDEKCGTRRSRWSASPAFGVMGAFFPSGMSARKRRVSRLAGMTRSPYLAVAATPNHTSRPPLSEGLVGTPELPCAADRVEHHIHTVAGQARGFA